MIDIKTRECYFFPIIENSDAIAYIIYYDCEYNDSNYDVYTICIYEIDKNLNSKKLSLFEKLEIEEKLYRGLFGGLYGPVVEPDSEGYVSYKDKIEVSQNLDVDIIYDKYSCNKEQLLILIEKILNGETLDTFGK